MAVNSRGDACDVVCVVRVVCVVLFLVTRSAMASRVARSRTASSSARREISRLSFVGDSPRAFDE